MACVSVQQPTDIGAVVRHCRWGDRSPSFMWAEGLQGRLGWGVQSSLLGPGAWPHSSLGRRIFTSSALQESAGPGGLLDPLSSRTPFLNSVHPVCLASGQRKVILGGHFVKQPRQ